MTLTIKYFASLREALGQDEEQVQCPNHVRTAGALRDWLCSRGEPYASALAPGRSLRIAINLEMAGPDAELPDPAEIAFFPPVTGG